MARPQIESPSENAMPARPGLTVCSDPVLRYAPFESGKYDTSPGLRHFRVDPSIPGQRLLQLDREYPFYRANKQQCRQTGLSRYCLEQELLPGTRQAVSSTLIGQLCASYPDFFRLEAPGRLHCLLSGELLAFGPDGDLAPHPVYLSLWDALASQIQEDLAVWQLQGERDWLAALHVCSPNGWAPAEKIGLGFDQVHAQVPGMESQRDRYLPLLQGLIRKPAFCRFLWDLRTDDSLDHHPHIHSPSAFSPEHPSLWVRLERQVLYGLPACDAVLFAIRTYRYPVQGLAAIQLSGLDRALAGMTPELLEYKRLSRDRDAIRAWLQALMRQGSDG